VIPAALAAILLSAVVFRLRLRWSVVTVVSAFVLACAGSVASFALYSHELPLIEAFFIFFPSALASVGVMTVSVEWDAARTRQALKCYLSPQIRDKIINGDQEVDLSTKRKEITVVFVDVEGFSTISETVEIEYLNRFLNDFFEMTTQAVFKYNGTVDKFLGDGLLAFFGDPLPMENHALAAIQAGIAMQQGMAELSARWARSGIFEFEKGVRIRIGMSTGMIIVGNIGSKGLMEYTVVGSAVNIASRLQSKAPPSGILMTARTWVLARADLPFEGPDMVRVKGIDRDLEVYTLRPLTKEPPPA
jgi:adenylate cyclase